MLEKGLNRFKPNEIEQDNANQSNARQSLIYFLDNVVVETQPMMSFWDWEFYRDNKIIALGEYRRRFNVFGTFPDFQFSKKKFDAMIAKGKQHNIPSYMFVEFNDLFMFFLIEGNPSTKIMRRNHEKRTEPVVCITNDKFQYLYELEI